MEVAGSNRGLHRFAVVVSVSTLALIFIGGLVTSTGSGLSVPDWPLSYGQVFPPMVGGVAYEHGHRMAAALVGLLTVVLAVWLWKREPRAWVRRLGVLALATVIAQGVLGGVTVLLSLPTAVSVGHAALAQIFLCLTVTIALVTSRGWSQRAPAVGAGAVPVLSTATTGIIFIQILLGAVVRHTGSGLAIPDFPLAFGRLVPPQFTPQILINFAHRVGAAAAAVLVLWLVLLVLSRHGRHDSLRIPALNLLAAMLAQILLGAITIWSGRDVIPTTAHVLFGALILTAALVLTLNAHRILAPGLLSEPEAAARTGKAREQ